MQFCLGETADQNRCSTEAKSRQMVPQFQAVLYKHDVAKCIQCNSRLYLSAFPSKPVCYSLVVSFTGIKHSVTGTWFIAQTFTLVLGLVCGDSKLYPRYISSIFYPKYNLSCWCHAEVTIIKLTATFLSGILISPSYLRNSCPNNSTTVDHWTFFPNE